MFEVIPDEGIGTLWALVMIYSVVLGFVGISYYKHTVMEEEIGGSEYLKRNIDQSRFKIMEQRDNTFLLKPRFDYPYSLFSGDSVLVKYVEDRAIIQGPKYYVEGLVKDFRGELNRASRFLSGISIVMLIFLMGILPLLPISGSEWTLKQWFHNLKIEVLAIDGIEIEDESAVGNTLSNTNSYGVAVESEDDLFYVYDHMNIVRVDKNFHNKVILTENMDGTGIDYLNVVQDWIFYRKGSKLHRMHLDGSNDQAIYNMSYLLDVHVQGNWIYFINPEDDFKIYQMTVNGEHINKFLNISVNDIAVFEDRLYFSYSMLSEGTDKGRLESITLEGYDQRIELDETVLDMTIHEGHYYYIGYGNQLYRSKINSDPTPETIVHQTVTSYSITDSGIFYTLRCEAEPDIVDGEGLYHMDFDGSEETLVLDCKISGGLTHVGDYILFSTFDENYYPQLHRFNLITNEVDIVE